MEELEILLSNEGVWPMTHGYHVSIRAKIWNVDANHPAGIDYGLTLMDPKNVRVLGFDNKHAYNGAGLSEPFDHEHRAGVVGIAFRYDFNGSYQLISDFYERVGEFVEQHYRRTGVRLEFLE